LLSCEIATKFMAYYKEHPLNNVMKLIPITLLLFITSCSLFGHEDSGNDKDKTTQIRDFTWRIDTVGTEFSLGGGIYGFGDDNIFLMGSFYSKEQGTYLRGMRWDGKEWTEDYYIPNIDFNIALNDATGDDTVLVTVGYWAGTSNESIATARYSNITNTWSMYKPDIEGRLLDVWTDSKGFYVAVGFSGLVATSENSGLDWNVSKGAEDHLDDYILQDVNGVSKNDYFIQGSRYNTEHSTYQYVLWRVKDGIWMKWIDSVNEEETKSELLFLDEYVGYEFYATKDEYSDTTYLF